MEIEVKVLDVDKGEVIRKLKKLGAKKISDVKQQAILFDFSDGRLTKEKKLLRLQKSEKLELTFKETVSKKKAKIKKEYEVCVDNNKEMIKILEGVGLKVKTKYSKKRISFKLGRVRFELDTYPGIPTFLEIEAPSLKKLKEAVGKLGYTMKDTKPWSGKDVEDYYKRGGR